MVKKFVFKTSLSVVIMGMIIGFNPFTNADEKNYWIKYCTDEQCINSSSVMPLSDYNKNVLKNGENNLFDIVALILSGSIPLIAFLWWIVNIQQDKKNLEQNIKYDNDLDNRINVITAKVDLLSDDIHHRIDNINRKIDEKATLVSDYQIETMKAVYGQNSKLDKLDNLEYKYKKYIERLLTMEKFLELHHKYRCRLTKEEDDLD